MTYLTNHPLRNLAWFTLVALFGFIMLRLLGCVDVAMAQDIYYERAVQTTPVLTARHRVRPTAKPTAAPTVMIEPEVVCSKSVTQVSTAQSVVNSAVSGQTVCVEPGTYNFPVAFFMKSGVRVYCKPGAKLVFDGGSQEGVRFNTSVTGATIEGCDISGGWDGVKDTGKGNIVKNNYIHNNKFMGILGVAVSNANYTGNRIEDNGSFCSTAGWGGYSPRHCHNVYISNTQGYCVPMANNKVTDNYLGRSGGFGVSVNGYYCPNHLIANTLISGNTIVDPNAGVGLYYYTSGTSITGNSFTIQNPPPSDMPSSMWCAVIAWVEQISQTMLNTNTFSLKPGVAQYCQY